MAKITDLPQHYDPEASRAKFYEQWEKQGYFRGDPKTPGPSFSIVIPPPNVTGSLHMGHALNNTLQDILIRYRRMDGYNAVWIPGTDHASIAVHWLVEKELKAEGTDRFALGREKFMERAWAFKKKAGGNIIHQLRQLGVSCDWTRERFTLDEGLSAAVRECFVRLYEEGLIYRAERLVNWDPVTQTTLSDLEVIHEEGVKGELWSFGYPLADGPAPDGRTEIVVATTRPETMLGDTAIAVHPTDERYKSLIGKNVRHPISGRLIPIVGDAILVDPEFGTGAVKVTPAHDPNDFEVGKRHNLPFINILTKDGKINQEGGAFEGMDRFAARTAVKEKLAELGLDRGTQDHTLNIGRSERSGAIVEPMLSTQWFVRAKPLAAPALAAVENGFTRFVPQQWENTYYSWLRDIRDWCISRQLWWGHQIPAWYCESCNQVNVARTAPEVCTSCGGKALRQDEDVLDTWFSSALWPFSTMGWPEKTEDLKRWYPTSTLITGFDIIFFWVARMMMFGQYFMGAVPFRDVYIHALIRDAQGEKMSKTKGNVIDPLEMVKKYGTDAFRFTLTAFAAQGRDVRWDEARAAGYHKFVNKVWQAFRFVTSNLEDDTIPTGGQDSVYDAWIKYRFGVAVTEVRQALESYRFNDAAAAIYTFIWDEFCDWYIEFSKVTLYDEAASPEAKAATRRTLILVWNGMARLMHPIMPFLAEELWGHIPGTQGSVMKAAFPKATDYPADEAAAAEAAFVKGVTTAIRRTRAEYTISPKLPLEVKVRAGAQQAAWLEKHAGVIQTLAKSTCTPLVGEPPKKVATEVVDGTDIFILLEGVIDFDAEITRLKKEVTKLDKEMGGIEKQLGNQDFVARAPEEIVVEKRQQLAAAQDKKLRLGAALVRLSA